MKILKRFFFFPKNQLLVQTIEIVFLVLHSSYSLSYQPKLIHLKITFQYFCSRKFRMKLNFFSEFKSHSIDIIVSNTDNHTIIVSYDAIGGIGAILVLLGIKIINCIVLFFKNLLSELRIFYHFLFIYFYFFFFGNSIINRS